MRRENCFLALRGRCSSCWCAAFYPFLTAGRGRRRPRAKTPALLKPKKVLHLSNTPLSCSGVSPSSSARECGRLARGRWASRPAVVTKVGKRARRTKIVCWRDVDDVRLAGAPFLARGRWASRPAVVTRVRRRAMRAKIVSCVTWMMLSCWSRRFSPVSHRRRGRPSAAGETPALLKPRKSLHLTEHSLVLSGVSPSSSA